MTPYVYSEDTEENSYTGRPSNEMSLYTSTMQSSEEATYRLRMQVSEYYNPQGDGGSKTFGVKVNVYGKASEKLIQPLTPNQDSAAAVLMKKSNAETLNYENATTEEKNNMWTFSHDKSALVYKTKDYRYVGADPNNYISFNNELWRIIGVFGTEDDNNNYEWRLKLIRNESIGDYIWDTTNGVSYSDSGLNSMLNKEYYNKTTGNYYTGTDYAATVDFSTNGLTDNAKELISPAKWYIGDVENYYNSGTQPDWIYKEERANKVWTGNVGLINVSDFGYATAGSDTKSREYCLSDELHSGFGQTMTCFQNDYLNIGDGVLLTSITSGGRNWRTSSSGIYETSANETPRAIYPSIYLKSNVVITAGDGTKSNPFQIKLG